MTAMERIGWGEGAKRGGPVSDTNLFAGRVAVLLEDNDTGVRWRWFVAPWA